MQYNQPVVDLIRQRYSCRTYLDKPIAEPQRQRVEAFLSSVRSGPLGTPLRFALLAATEQGRSELRGLGTYGFIRGATGFIVGAAGQGPKNLEDFGYRMEEAVLLATDLGLGTCWLGGTFTRSRFATRIGLREGELLPSVTATGHRADRLSLVDRLIHLSAGSECRLPWRELFFDGSLGSPLLPEMAGPYAGPLEMVRLAPSARNKQPWRILRRGEAWHFYLQRSPDYGQQTARRFLGVDLPRVDLGIALCHFELTARELGLAGRWAIDDPGIEKPDDGTEYVVSWGDFNQP